MLRKRGQPFIFKGEHGFRKGAVRKLIIDRPELEATMGFLPAAS